MTQIVPAILTTSDEDLKDKLKQAQTISNRVQIDVMDETFVPFFSTAGNGIESPCILEAHLMINNPNIAEYSNFDVIIVHAEACDDLGKTIFQIKALDIRSGIAINPETPITKIKELIPEIDQITIMSVNPGKQGQKFMPEVLEKVRFLKQEYPNILVEVDGGITEANIHQVVDAGADLVAVGHSLFNDDVFKENFKHLLKEI